MTGPGIRTARLVLSPLGLVDAPRLFKYRSVAEVARYQTWVPRTVDDARRFIEDFGSVAFDTPGAWSQLGISLARDGLIGDVGVHVPLNEPLQAEIGVTLAPDHRGRGFATEAVRGLLGHLLGTLEKHRVFASVDPRNEPSLALLERVGMRREAHFRQSLLFKGCRFNFYLAPTKPQVRCPIASGLFAFESRDPSKSVPIHPNWPEFGRPGKSL